MKVENIVAISVLRIYELVGMKFRKNCFVTPLSSSSKRSCKQNIHVFSFKFCLVSYRWRSNNKKLYMECKHYASRLFLMPRRNPNKKG